MLDFLANYKWKKPGGARFLLLALALGLTLGPAFGSVTPEKKTVVVLGDSIAAGYGVEPDEAFPALLQQKIDEAGLPFRVVNAAVSGDTTAGGLRRIGWTMRQRVDVLLLELGGNDGLRGVSPSETKKNLEGIIAQVREKYPEVKVVLAGMQMPKNMGAEYTREFQEIFPTVSKEQGTALIPFILEGVGGTAEYNQPDRIHPNPEGHRMVAENAWKVLKPILEQESK